MTQQINKDVLIANIEKLIKLFTKIKNQKGISQINRLSLNNRIAELQELKVFIDNVKVINKTIRKENK